MSKQLSLARHRQAAELDALILAATRCRRAAAYGCMFNSRNGLELVRAAYTLFEVDGLHTLAQDIEHDIAMPEPELSGATVIGMAINDERWGTKL